MKEIARAVTLATSCFLLAVAAAVAAPPPDESLAARIGVAQAAQDDLAARIGDCPDGPGGDADAIRRDLTTLDAQVDELQAQVQAPGTDATLVRAAHDLAIREDQLDAIVSDWDETS